MILAPLTINRVAVGGSRLMLPQIPGMIGDLVGAGAPGRHIAIPANGLKTTNASNPAGGSATAQKKLTRMKKRVLDMVTSPDEEDHEVTGLSPAVSHAILLCCTCSQSMGGLYHRS